MEVDVYTPIKEFARYLSKRFNKRFRRDESEDPIIYNVCKVEYKDIESLLSEFMCEVRNSKNGRIIWPRLSKEELEKRFGL